LAEGSTAELIVGWEFKSLPENIYDSELCKGFPMGKNGPTSPDFAPKKSFQIARFL
jgi:hypothetical protein